MVFVWMLLLMFVYLAQLLVYFLYYIHRIILDFTNRGLISPYLLEQFKAGVELAEKDFTSFMNWLMFDVLGMELYAEPEVEEPLTDLELFKRSLGGAGSPTARFDRQGGWRN